MVSLLPHYAVYMNLAGADLRWAHVPRPVFPEEKQITKVERQQTIQTSKAWTRGQGFVIRQSVCDTPTANWPTVFLVRGYHGHSCSFLQGQPNFYVRVPVPIENTCSVGPMSKLPRNPSQ